MKFKLSAVAAALAISSTVIAAEPTNQEILDLIKQHEAQIQQLKQTVETNEKKAKATDQKVEASAQAIEQSLATSSQSATRIGGYGELHYNNIEGDKEIDFHRFVLFIGHEFSDSVRFFSEFELEHSIAGEGKKGEIELEQAYIEMDLSEATTLKTGLFLVPVGIINETHEPATFYGVERNPVEKEIIPATWWEAGAGISTKFSEGWSADFALHSGLSVPTTDSKAFLVRNGRQKVSEANAENLAFTARVKYTAIPGLELAASYQIQDDVTQGELGAGASLFTAHAAYQSGAFGLRALYAMWNIDGAAAQAIGRDEQSGFYIEPSYKLNEKFGIFARYNAWDNNAGDASFSEKRQSNYGLNYWPVENVALKLDLEQRSGILDGNGFNLGVGYQF